jgi:hypothetical protein
MAVERKYERDIDVLLAEEFSVSPEFARWFLSKSKFGSIPAQVFDVFVSKSDNLGESDLVVVYDLCDGKRIALLIEDKVDAQLQHRQAERYKERADREIQAGNFSDYETVLCAPESYPKLHDGSALFDRFVAYEEIAEFLVAKDSSPRAKYRASFVATAAARRSNAWVREQDEATDEFWNAVYQIAVSEFPTLERKPIRVTKNSPWINFRPSDMPTKPKSIYVAMKAYAGHIDLTFSDTVLLQFLGEIESLLQDGMTVHQTAKATAIRIDTRQPFWVGDGMADGLPKARIALVAVQKLVEFYRTHRKALDAAALSATPPK